MKTLDTVYNMSLTFDDVHSIVLEKIQVSKEIIENKYNWDNSDIEKALNIINAYYSGVKLRDILSMPLNF